MNAESPRCASALLHAETSINTAVEPGVAFVVPAYNEETTLPAALAAIRSAADKAGIRYEIAVVDDASSDATAAVAHSHGAAVVSVAKRQIAATRNAGARSTRALLLIFVDADTLIDAAVLQATLAAVADGAIGGGAGLRFDEPAPRYARWLLAALVPAFRAVGWAAGCYLFCTRTAFNAVGGFDERLFASEEIALSRALKRHGRFVVLRQKVVTSARKARSFSAWEHLALISRLLSAGPRVVYRRDRLSFWYVRRADPRDRNL